MSDTTRRAHAFLQLVEIMSRLRGTDGCPWDAEQTPESLIPFMLEETHEAIEAIASGNTSDICEELGDMLLQVIFQAELFHETGQFDIADVCACICDKLIRRHPHVFAATELKHRDELLANWDRIKRAEKPAKGSHPLAGEAPLTLPALARSQALLRKAQRRRLPLPSRHDEGQCTPLPLSPTEAGNLLFEYCRQANEADIDLEQALSSVTRTWLNQVEIASAKGDPEGSS